MLEIITSLFIYFREREKVILPLLDRILFFTNKKIEHEDLFNMFFFIKKILKKFMHASN
jgi:hypothetical protein